MAKVRIKMNPRGIEAILKGAAPHTQRIADRVAASVVQAVGTIDGQMVDPQRYDEPTKQRARSAVVLTHPSAKGRLAARDAADAALRVAGE
jgi:hypothetical protein